MTDDVLHAGQRVRLLVQGTTGTHSLEGILRQALPDLLVLSLTSTGRELSLPAAVCISLERGVTVGALTKWSPAHLPTGMGELVKPLDQIFRAGTGGVAKHVDAIDTTAALESLRLLRESLVSEPSRRVVDALIESIASLHLVQTSKRYEEAHRSKDRCLNQVVAIIEVLDDFRESEKLRLAATELANRISTVAGRFWADYQSRFEPRPQFLIFPEPPVVSVNEANEAQIPLRVHLDDGYAPIDQLEVMIDELPGINYLGARPRIEQVESGQTCTLEQACVVDPARILKGDVVRLRAQLRYRQPDRQMRKSPKQNLDFRLHFPQAYEPIDNPFTAYSGGTSVADSKMFFGRQALIDEISSQLASGPLGQCFALYGQKRSGKSSLMEQARLRLNKTPTIVVTLSFGTIDRYALTESFVREVLEQVRVPLLEHLPGEDFRKLEKLWPTADRIEERPLESLRTALTAGRRMLSRYPGWAGLRYVILVDEFTYLFEVLRRPDASTTEVAGVREFMRQWKALLESQYFSSLVVGQDTMLEFMNRFPNEFSVMNPRKLSYLKPDETIDLVTKPILRSDGSSRYMGYAGQTIYGYTDGHPFFTQIVCDRLVREANKRQRGEFTESDVIEAIQTLVFGADSMDFYRFDCLLTADNTGFITASPTVGDDEFDDAYDDQGRAAFELLHRIAVNAGDQNRGISISSLELDSSEQLVFNDLLLREVLIQQLDAVRIRVLLFADYLRRM